MKTKNKVLLGIAAVGALSVGGYNALTDKQNVNHVVKKLEEKELGEIPDIYNNQAQEISGVLVNLPDKNFDINDSTLGEFDSALNDAEKMLHPDVSDINDSAELVGENIGKKFSDEDWKNLGYKIVESEDNKIPNTDILMSRRVYEKDGVSVTRFFDNKEESGLYIDYEDGTKIQVGRFNTLSSIDEEGIKRTFSPTDIWEENFFDRYLDNDSLSSLSAGEIADFFEALENEQGIEVKVIDTNNPEEVAENTVDPKELERKMK